LIRILLDEHVSPSLVGKLGDKGVLAVAAAHVGLSGEPDAKIWNYAFENDFVVVTGNARDFIRLLNVEVHPGLIVLREGGLTRDEQWDRIRPVIEHVLESSDDNFLVTGKFVRFRNPDQPTTPNADLLPTRLS
jgi:predicted nuclease of predicted toxin-antitoxin system